jgi:HAD superfamily hydrolase (TIGR01509 family)
MSPSEARAGHLRAACFDLDGVVVDSEPLHFEAEKEALAHHGVDLTLDDKAEFVGYPLHEVAVRMAARFGLPDAEAFYIERQRIFQALVASRLGLRRGVAGLLDLLASRGVHCALVTSGPRRYVDGVLARFGLGRYFDFVIAEEDVREHKPAPGPYLAAARLLALPPAACLALEDSPTGVTSAKAAGLYCVAIPSQPTAGSDLSLADERIDSLTDFGPQMADRLFVPPTPIT